MKPLAAILACLLAGCTTWKPVREYHVQLFTLSVGSAEYVQAVWESYGNHGKQVGGFMHYPSRTIYVPYSVKPTRRGEAKPNFEVLGHEVWHLDELGGRWHD